MGTVNAVLATVDTALPAGQVFDHIAVVLTDSAGVAQTARVNGAMEKSVTFENVAAGDFTVTATAYDTANAQIGEQVSASGNVPEVLTFPAPVSITITVG